MTVFVVTSFRDYGDGEQYFSADGVFYSKETAVAYIKRDIHDRLNDYVSLYDDDQICNQAITDDDTSDYRIDFDGHTFAWHIDEFALIAEGNHDS